MATTDVQKLARIGARVYQSEHVALALLAEREGRNQADVLRELVRDRARELGLWPLPKEALEGARAATQ